MKMTNRIENMIIAFITLIISVTLTYTIVNRLKVKPLETELKETKQMVMELAKLEKYKYEIKNEFQKIKTGNGEVILQIDNKMDAATGKMVSDTTIFIAEKIEPEKKGFFGRLFNKSK